MATGPRVVTGLLGSVLSLTAACGEEQAPWPIGFDGSFVDSGADAPARDAGGGPLDPLDAGVSGECSGDELIFPAASAEQVSFDVAIHANQVELIYLITGCGDAPGTSAARELVRVRFGSTGPASEPVPVGPVAGESCVRVRELAVASSAGRVDLFYTSSSGEPFELDHEALVQPSQAAALTADPELELKLVSAMLRGEPAATAVYTPRLSLAPPPVATSIAAVQPGSARTEVLAASVGHRPMRLAMTAVAGPSVEARGVVVWASDLPPNTGVYMRRVGAAGKGIGDVITLSERAGISSHVAATRGAVVYTRAASEQAEQTLSFRELGPDGLPGTEVPLAGTNQDVAEISIAPYAGGYALAYRRQANAVRGVPATVRLLFVDTHGTQAGSRFVANTGPVVLGMRLLVAQDGRLVLVWSEQAAGAPDSALIHVRRLRCL